jgi:hypothetical protein
VIYHLKLILIVGSSSSTLITLEALLLNNLTRLEVVIELPLYVVSLGKFVLLIFVIVSSSMLSW